jgi:hypothetical protein
MNPANHSRLASMRRPGRYMRRRFDRRLIDGVATLFELTGDRFGSIHTTTTIDYSDGGMAALSDELIPPGTTVSVGFQSPQCTSRHGRVVRCIPTERGYRVAVAFQG